MVKMFDATAHKPFVYRQLAPMLSDVANRLVPDEVKNYVAEKIVPSETFARLTSLSTADLRFRYVVVYYLSFSAFLFSLFVLREIALDAGAGKMASVVAPASFVLAFPYFQTIGGYFYDSIELFFLSLSFLLASRGKVLSIFVLLLPATLNKETFFFFIPTLYPLLRQHHSMPKSLASILGAMCFSGMVNAVMKYSFINADGVAAEFHLKGNIYGYLSPLSYFQLEDTYGIVGPSGMFAGVFFLIFIILFRGWSKCLPSIKHHILIASAINIPLFLIFAAMGELRNLSFLFIGLVIIVAVTLDQYGGGTRQGINPAIR